MFLEGHKFISFCTTVTCLPSLNKAVTLPYLNIYSPFIVQVAVMITNIHKSLAVTLYLIKHRILIRGGLWDVMSLHVMYYRPSDRSIG